MSTAPELEFKQKPAIHILVGKPESGKSVALRTLLYDYLKAGYFKFGIVLCPTPGDTFNFLDQKYVIQEWGKDAKGKARTVDDYVLSYWQGMVKATQKGTKLPPNFIVMDDCLGAMNFQRPEIQNWLARFRHTNTSVFFAMQYLAGIGSSTALREYTDIAFFWPQTSENAIMCAHKGFGGDFDKNQWAQLMRRIGDEKYRALVVRPKLPLNERYIYWKATPPPPFKALQKKKKVETGIMSLVPGQITHSVQGPQPVSQTSQPSQPSQKKSSLLEDLAQLNDSDVESELDE